MADLIKFKPALPAPQRERTSSRETVVEKYRPFRTLLLFDATGSMSPYWNEVAKTISTIIERVKAIAGTVDMKIVAYRDDSDGDLILESSPWSHSESELKKFLGTIACAGGDDFEEAVDRALQFALQEKDLSRIILIGDAPPHSKIPGRDCRKEAVELKQKHRPVYPIMIGQHEETRKAFSMIAEESGGKLIQLTNLEELFELITILVLNAKGGTKLLDDYRRQYKLTSGAIALLEDLTNEPRKG